MLNSFIREHVVKRLTRSWGWGRVRRRHVKLHPFCAACGRVKNLQVHHIIDFSTTPDLELETTNLITLCAKGMNCHFSFGHLGSWKSINPSVIHDASWFLEKVKGRRGNKTD